MAGYGRCGWQFKLTRVDGETEHPSVALAGGSGFHSYTEDDDWYRLNGLDKPGEFVDYFERELARIEEETGVPRDEFKTSGRKTKERPNGEDIQFWSSSLGPDMVETYRQFEWPDGWTIARDLPPDSSGRTTGIEYHGELLDPPFQFYADRIFDMGDGNLCIVDLKTWQRKRTSAQLQEYMVAGQLLGLRTVYGAYYSARKGELDGPHICKWTEQTFRDYISVNMLGIESGLYLPVVGDNCDWCGVRKLCQFAP